MTERDWRAEVSAIKSSPRQPLQAPWTRNALVNNPFSGSIFNDKRQPSPRQAPKALPPVEYKRPTKSTYQPAFWSGSLAHPSASYQATRVTPSGVEGKRTVGPDRWDVHGSFHVGGSSGLVAAGVRTQTGTPANTPWTVATGKPPGGWSVAGAMAVGW